MTTVAEPRPATPRAGRADPAFERGLAGIALVGLVIRVAYILLERRGLPVGGDAFAYHEGANLLADGHGFIEPYSFFGSGAVVESADHPPLYTIYLAAFSLVGLTQATSHMLASALLGTATITVVGLVGRRIGGTTVGLVAAGLAAVYPNFWHYDGSLMSESLAQLCVAVTALLAYRCWDGTGRRGIAVFGVVIGLAALTRSELVLLVPLLLWPVVGLAPGIAPAERWRLAAVGSVAAALTIAPWSLYNLTRFEHPVLLSGQLQATLLVANCDTAYYETVGYWSKPCLDEVLAASGLPDTTDRSVLAEAYQDAAFDYIGDHLDRVPVVVAARIGRTFGVYAPSQQILTDQYASGRERWVARSAAVGYLVLLVAAVAGGVILRRRRTVPLFPLLAAPATVVLTVALIYAETRFRATAESSVVLLAAVALVAAGGRLRRRAEPPPVPR